MILYYITGSCSLSPKIIMNEIGTSADFIQVKKNQISKGVYETSLPDGSSFAKVFLKAQIPALQIENGVILSENANILQYIADINNATALLPDVKNIRRYQIIEWLNYIATELHKTLTYLFYIEDYSLESKTKFESDADVKLKFINHSLEGKNYLVEDFSIADAYMFVCLTWTQFLNIDLKKYPNIHNYYNLLISRDSVKKALDSEGLNYKPL